MVRILPLLLLALLLTNSLLGQGLAYSYDHGANSKSLEQPAYEADMHPLPGLDDDDNDVAVHASSLPDAPLSIGSLEYHSYPQLTGSDVCANVCIRGPPLSIS